MAICGWCQNSGTYGGKTCVCTTRRRAFFAKGKKAKPAEYAFDRAHKCGPDVQEFLYEKGNVSFYLCECGKMVKVTA